MTFYLTFRTRDVGGPVRDPVLLEGDGATDPGGLRAVPANRVASLLAGRDLLFATHGFNVSGTAGARALGRLDTYLALPPAALFVGMLWPGDSWLPVVDYPFEGGVAIDCGDHLARFCNGAARPAASLSFLSHSLGARLVLQALVGLDRRARSVCLTAAAINRDCLNTQYALAADNAERIAVLASREDRVLSVAFSLGDPLAELLHDDHAPFQPALGRNGPADPVPGMVRHPIQIPDCLGYDHGDYLPPSAAAPPPAGQLWPAAADFMRRAFLDQPQSWPPTWSNPCMPHRSP